MDYTKNENYGRIKCCDCLLHPGGDDPIFIGIPRLISKGLGLKSTEYPCQVVNRFRCPYERTKEEENHVSTNPHFDVEDLFRLRKMAFVVEIALAKARKDDSKIQIKDKQDLFDALTDQETFTKILEQAANVLESTEYLRENSAGLDRKYIVEYFMRIKNKITLDELRFY